MRIVNVNNDRVPEGIDIHADISPEEFEQLGGELEDLKVFARQTLEDPASIIRTGAKNTYAKYLLVPSRLRKEHPTTRYDFDRVRCGLLKDEEWLYVIYAVPRKGAKAKKKAAEPAAVGQRFYRG